MQIKSTFRGILSTNGAPAARAARQQANTMKNTAPPRALRGRGFTGAAPPTATI